MATGTKTLQYKIGMDIGELRRNAEAAGTYTAGFRRELDELEKKQRAHRKSLDDFGKGMATFGAATVAGLGIAAKAAIDWETAWTGVRKTVDGSDQQMAQLEGQLRGLARALPASHKEIAAVAEAAGQLGIKRQDIAKFTKTMIDLGETTNLTAEDAATALAKFSNVMGTSASDADRLGATIVALGNDGASTEQDIVEMALRIAGAGKQLKLSESQVLGFASALSSVGIEAEAGGSSISTVMVNMAAAVNKGGSQLDAFAKVAGLTGSQFAQSFKTDAAGAIVSFLQGLGRMQKGGENVFGTLDGLGLSEIRVRDALLRAGAASDVFTKSIRVGSTAWSQNTALTDEANKRYATSASKLQVAWNQIQDALIDVGGAIVPVVSKATSGIADLVAGFQALPGPVKDIVTWVGVAAGTVALFGGAAAIAVPKVLAFRASMATMAATGGAITGTIGKLGLALAGPWGAALAAGTALLGFFTVGQGKAEDATAKFTYELDKQTGVLSKNNIEALHKYLAEAKIGLGGVIDQDAGSKLTDIIKTLGVSFDQLIGYITSTGAAQDAFHDKLWNADISSGGRMLLQFLDSEREKYQAQTAEQRAASSSADQFSKKTGESAAAQSQLAQQLGQTDEQIKQAADDLGKLIQSLDDTNGRTLNARSAQRDFMDAVQDARNAVTAAAEARIQAAERVESAERSVQSAQRSAKAAQDSYTQAQRDARDAQEALTRARAAEVERLEDLNRAVTDAALDQEGAEIALQRARERLSDVQSKGTGGLDLREADLEVRRAEQGLINTRDRYADIAAEAAAANKAGVEGSDAVMSAQRGVAESAKGIVDAQQGVADAARDVRDALKEAARAAADPALRGFVRTLDDSTEAGRRNAEMLDRIASAANANAQKAASDAERFSGAAAGAAALTASLKAARPALVATAVEFGMSQQEAEKYADQVLAIPPVASTLVMTPGSQESLRELQRVRDAVNGIPVGKTVNVGVLSEQAIAALDRVGYKTERLPNGTVTVQALTAGAQQQLDNFINVNQNRAIHIIGTYEPFYQGQGGKYYAAQGGIVAFASGGMHEDHRPQIARARKGTARMWAEPETGRESYIPWAMDRRDKATSILRATANGFGYNLTPHGVPATAIAPVGVPVGMGGFGGVALTVDPGGATEFQRFMARMISKYVRVNGNGQVQSAFGQTY